MARRLTNEEWVTKAKEKFPNLDFNNTLYINKRSNVTIVCPIHGPFTVNAGAFMLTKYGCPKCGHTQSNQNRTTSQEEYISKAKIAYGHLYDCSKIVYKGSREKITLICPKHGDFKIRADNLNAQCPKCSGSYLRTHEEFVQELKEKFPNINILLGQFKTVRSRFTFECNDCGHIWENTAESILSSKYACPKCAHIKAKISNRLNPEDFKNRLKNISPEIELLESFTTCRNRIKCKCKNCGNIWNPKAIYLLQLHKCSECSKKLRGLKNENIIKEYCKNKQISYIHQYKIMHPFEGRNFIKVDFYLPEHNLFIEYNGKQHYVPIEYFGGELNFQKLQLRDENLRKYCKENNINLLEIRYDENIEEKLNKYFNKLESIK